MTVAEADQHPIKTKMKLLRKLVVIFQTPPLGSLQHLPANLSILSISEKEVVHSSGMNSGSSSTPADSLTSHLSSLLSLLPPLSSC